MLARIWLENGVAHCVLTIRVAHHSGCSPFGALTKLTRNSHGAL